MFNPNLISHRMLPENYLQQIDTDPNNIIAITKEVRKYIKYWITSIYQTHNKRAVNSLIKRVSNIYTDLNCGSQYTGYIFSNDKENTSIVDKSIIKKCVISYSGTAVTTSITFNGILSDIIINITNFLYNDMEVMINVSSALYGDDTFIKSISDDKLNIVKLNGNYYEAYHNAIIYNLVRFQNALKIFKELEKDDTSRLETVFNAYQLIYFLALTSNSDDQKIRQFITRENNIIKIDKGKILNLMSDSEDCKKLFGADAESAQENFERFKDIVNENIQYYTSIQPNTMIPIEDLYNTIAHIYIDYILSHTYRAYDFFVSNNCPNEEVINLTKDLISRDVNCHLDLIDLLKNLKEAYDQTIKSMKNNSSEEDKEEYYEDDIELFYDALRKSFPMIEWNTGMMSTKILLGNYESNFNNAATIMSKLNENIPIDGINNHKEELENYFKKYRELREKYGIHNTISNMNRIYSDYCIPIMKYIITAIDNISSFENYRVMIK